MWREGERRGGREGNDLYEERERNHEGGRKRCRHVDTAPIALGGVYLQADCIHHNNKSYDSDLKICLCSNI